MISMLTHKLLETHVATDVLVLKHQAISSYSADLINIIVDQFYKKKCWIYIEQLNNLITFWKKINK